MPSAPTIPSPPLSNRERFFATKHLKADLKGRSVRGGAATMAGQGANFIIHTASTVILARLLTPQDYGMIAMITAVTGFVTLFKDLGLSMATVQKDKITHEQISMLFWINVALSAMVMLVTMALAPVIAWFYGEPKLLPLTLVMAVGFVFGGLCVQHSALLRRQMRFGALVLIDVLRLLVSVAVGIVTALAGAGVWALVFMTLSGNLFNAIAVWVVCPWCPSLPVRHAGVRGMVRFGANLTGFNILNYFARNLDSVLIGRVWGAGALGFYAKAYGLLTLPLSQINAPVSAVAIPSLSRIQDDPQRYRNYYLKTISILSFVTMPPVMFLLVMSREVVAIVLGPQWSEVSRIFMILGIAALGQPIASSTGWLYVSQGRTGDMFRWGIVGSSITLAAILLGLPWGPVGVATSYTALNSAAMPLLLWFVCRKGPIQAWDVYRAMILPLCVSFCVGGALAVAKSFSAGLAALVVLSFSAMVTVVIMLLSLFLVPHGKELRKSLVDVARSFRGRQTQTRPITA